MKFPHDRKITVMRADMSTYKTLESAHMTTVQQMSESEIRVAQLFRAQRLPEDSLITSLEL